MSPTRREVLIGLGGSLAYAVQIGCSPGDPEANAPVALDPLPAKPGGRPHMPDIDAREWLIISPDGSVTVYTARTEIGQGLTTILYDLVGQALELPNERINIVMGDTDLCPSDGPTTGSAATRHVAWAFWIACHQIKDDLVLLAAEATDGRARNLEYSQGEIVNKRDRSKRIGIGELADGQVRRVKVDPVTNTAEMPQYEDRRSLNVNAEAIVTGTQTFTADLYPEGCLYGGVVIPDYHWFSTRLRSAKRARARKLPGVVGLKKQGRSLTVLGDSYTTVQKAMEALDARWWAPDRQRELDKEAEIRAGAELKHLVEEQGDVDAGLGGSDLVISETYLTQYASQVPLETDTAIASIEDGRVTVHVGTQNPFLTRWRIAQQEGIDESQVRVISMPSGGAFGSKAGHTVADETVRMLEISDGAPVKYIYSRLADIQRRGRYKEAVVFDVTSGLDSLGRLVARKIDIFQDEGHGTVEMYDIPHVQTRLLEAQIPPRHATMRGTSFAQSVFALESHTDVLAEAAGLDPLAFRRHNIALPAFQPLLDACAEMLDYSHYEPPEDNGIGFAICNHGGRQLGVVGAEVRVDRRSGRVTVERLAGAFDFGLVINRRLATNGVKSAMIWGLSFALLEDVDLDGHSCYTTGFSNYDIARMSDTPPIEIAYFDTQNPGKPRGCGEMPLPPTTAAIANAVYRAIGVRFYELPLTPARVKAALLTSPPDASV